MLFQADAALIPFADKTFHTCVTSPPYWGLRKYQGKQGRVWGGDKDCVHEWVNEKAKGMSYAQGNPEFARPHRENKNFIAHSSTCQKCGAWFGGLGLEPTPQLHIQHIVEIFREVYRVLRDDGVVWLNYGDCYSTGHAAGTIDDETGWKHGKISHGQQGRAPSGGRAQGNLHLMPHRIAIALQDDGWIVRNDLVWRKSNPMPESCAGWRFERERTKIRSQKPADEAGLYAKGSGNPRARPGSDGVTGKMPEEYQTIYEYGEDYELRKGSWRHTRAHEFIFMLTKKMGYWCNQEAVREGYTEPLNRWGGDTLKEETVKHSKYLDMMGISPTSALRAGRNIRPNPSGRNPRSVFDVPQEALDVFRHWLGERTGIDLHEAIALFNQELTNPEGILDVPTQSYKGAHYATYPENLIAPLIRASCPRRACPECGQGWSPVVEPSERYAKLLGQSIHDHSRDDERGQQHDKEQMKAIDSVRSSGLRHAEYKTLGYRPTCECGHDEFVPGIVLDTFIGSGTTGAVAKELQRRWVGLDISMEYLDEQAKIRALNLTPSKALDDLPLFNI